MFPAAPSTVGEVWNQASSPLAETHGISFSLHKEWDPDSGAKWMETLVLGKGSRTQEDSETLHIVTHIWK